MGSSYWSDDFYRDRVAVRAKAGTDAFAHHDAVTKGTAKREVHAQMNPKDILRESRDSEAHPDSVAIGVMLDVTGSMSNLPRVIQAKLPSLMGLLVRRGYVKDPQVLFGAVGDARSDYGSLQIGQFESGIEMDDDLGKFWLEGGGGGSKEESYQNAIFFFARHTSIDCFEKRQKKGYLFVIGDEKPYPNLSKSEVRSVIGDSIDKDMKTEEIVKECQKKYNVFFIIPAGASHGKDSDVRERWTQILGAENVIVLDNAEAVSETIALAIGLCEGTAKLDNAIKDLTAEGASEALARSVTSAVGLSRKEAVVRL